MSHILKALNKAYKEQVSGVQASGTDKVHAHDLTSDHDATHKKGLIKTFDFQMLFMGVLIVLAGIGVYLSYNISANLSSTQNRMVLISEQFNMQQEKLNKLNELILQMDVANSGQSKEFLTKIDALSASVQDQIRDVQILSKTQYSELSKIIEEQKMSIANLTTKYDQLDKTVTNFTDVNSNYIEQLNILKRKIAEINSAQQDQ